ALLVDAPGAGKRASAEGGTYPAQECRGVFVPQRVESLGRVAAEEIVSGEGRRGLIETARVVGDILVEAAPTVPGGTVRIELLLQEPRPGEVACACVRGGVPGADLDQLVEKSKGPDD